MRKQTGDDQYYTEWERKNQAVNIGQRLQQTVLKPVIIIIEEPMLLLLTLYGYLQFSIILHFVDPSVLATLALFMG